MWSGRCLVSHLKQKGPCNPQIKRPVTWSLGTWNLGLWASNQLGGTRLFQGGAFEDIEQPGKVIDFQGVRF